MVPIWKSHAAILPVTQSILKVCITLAVSRRRKRERSGRCRRSAPLPGSAGLRLKTLP
jgi:hypothetical protein